MTTRHAATGVDNDITGKKGTLPALGGLNLYEGLTRRHAGKDFVVGEVDGTKVRVRVGEDDLVLNTADVRRLLALAPSGSTLTPLRRLGSTFGAASPSRSLPTGGASTGGLRRFSARSVVKDAQREAERVREIHRQAELLKTMEAEAASLRQALAASKSKSIPAESITATSKSSRAEVEPEVAEAVPFAKLLESKGLATLVKPLTKAGFDRSVLAEATLEEVVAAVRAAGGVVPEATKRLLNKSGLIAGDAPEAPQPTAEPPAAVADVGKPNGELSSLLKNVGSLIALGEDVVEDVVEPAAKSKASSGEEFPFVDALLRNLDAKEKSNAARRVLGRLTSLEGMGHFMADADCDEGELMAFLNAALEQALEFQRAGLGGRATYQPKELHVEACGQGPVMLRVVKLCENVKSGAALAAAARPAAQPAVPPEMMPSFADRTAAGTGKNELERMIAYKAAETVASDPRQLAALEALNENVARGASPIEMTDAFALTDAAGVEVARLLKASNLTQPAGVTLGHSGAGKVLAMVRVVQPAIWSALAARIKLMIPENASAEELVKHMFFGTVGESFHLDTFASPKAPASWLGGGKGAKGGKGGAADDGDSGVTLRGLYRMWPVLIFGLCQANPSDRGMHHTLTLAGALCGRLDAADATGAAATIESFLGSVLHQFERGWTEFHRGRPAPTAGAVWSSDETRAALHRLEAALAGGGGSDSAVMAKQLAEARAEAKKSNLNVERLSKRINSLEQNVKRGGSPPAAPAK